MLPTAILTIAPSSRRTPVLAVVHARKAGVPATTPPNGGYVRATPATDRRGDSADAHQAAAEAGPETVPERDAAAPATFAPHRCRRFPV
ncbi:hypothetical protein GT755_25925 [Herbidospora sp. NEAU-GS84]|uniref:Uncharacterized protein n=1 Tax=Herbidospora solisilvae TaxID=2696284 RepID=A0A7C9JAU1_9ACTN|nr:hypothetical protein [Herbidospora solisilvae]NAS25108.1 hypothetical protein [Herbidospora solisilvae]